jgi:hypothetical protein
VIYLWSVYTTQCEQRQQQQCQLNNQVKKMKKKRDKNVLKNIHLMTPFLVPKRRAKTNIQTATSAVITLEFHLWIVTKNLPHVTQSTHRTINAEI